MIQAKPSFNGGLCFLVWEVKLVCSRLYFVGVLLVVVLLYLPVYGFQYVWDDFALFLDSSALRGGSNIWSAISQPILPGTTYFRPLVLLSFFLEFKLCGLDPKYAHLLNLFFHLLNVFLVGLLANAMKGRDGRVSAWRSVIAMLLYGLHPALIEPVAWASGRFDLLVTTFVLFGIYAGLKGGRAGLIVALLSFFLGALCKEMAATFPLLLILFIWCVEVPKEKDLGVLQEVLAGRAANIVAGVILVGGVYLVLRYLAVANMYHQDLSVAGALDHWERAALVGHTVAFYFRMILWPFSDLNPMHPFEAAGMSPEVVAIGLSMLAIYILFCIFTILVRGRVLLLFLAGVIALLPVLNLIPLTIGGNIGHERFLVMPMAFFALGVSQLDLSGVRLSTSMRQFYPLFVGGVMAMWLGGACLNIKVTLPLWRDELALWSWAYERYPNFPYVQFSFLAAAIRNGQLDLAGAVIDEIDEKGGFFSPKIHAIKGLYLQRRGRYEEALKYFKGALGVSYQPHLDVLNRGLALDNADIKAKSFGDSWFLRFIYGGMAEANLSLRNYDEAIAQAAVARFYQRDYAPSYLIASLAMYGKGSRAEADDLFSKALGYYTEQGSIDARKIRSSFLHQICSFPERSEAVCDDFSD